MSNTLWHPASEPPRERTQPLLLATKTTWRDKDGKILQGFSPTSYFLGCYADGQFWDEIGERLPKDVTVTHWMRFRWYRRAKHDKQEVWHHRNGLELF